MGSLFSSPGKQAQQAATAEQGLTAQDLALAKQYANTTATNTQNVIAQMGPNPYFGAAANMSPSNYAVNPNDTTTFGVTSPPGTTQGNSFAQSSGQANGAAPPAQPPSQYPPGQTPVHTQPVAQNTGTNPFSNGKKNTQAIAALLGL